MKKKKFVYLMSFLVLVGSALFTYFLPVGEVIKGLSAIPGIGALCLSLYKSWKDEQLQNKQQDFILGTASHMAEVAYDKHVLFCEEYICGLLEGLQQIYREGASKGAIDIGRKLVNIRHKHSAWVTKEIERKLSPIENALIEMGAKKHLIEDEEVGENRSQTVQRIYELLGQILGDRQVEDSSEQSNTAINDVIEIIREILGINALTELRLEATKLAIKRLK